MMFVRMALESGGQLCYDRQKAGKGEPEMNEKQRRRLMEIMPILVIGAALLSFVLACAVYAGKCDRELGRLEDGWVLSGKKVDQLPMREAKVAGEDTLMQLTLGDDFADMQALCFYSVYADVEVRLDGGRSIAMKSPRRSM